MWASLEGLCERPSRVLLLESAFRNFFAVVATHILAGEIDTDFAGGSLWEKISWLVRYFNPVNLCWRYYSMLAFRFSCKSWGSKQLALINFEAYPYRAPIPFIVGEKLQDFYVKRLEISGLLSSQGLLSVIAAYQGIVAVQFCISSHALSFLPTVAKPLAILGLIRCMVSNWIASKVYVEPFSYPQAPPGEHECNIVLHTSNKLILVGWVSLLVALVMLSLWPYIADPPFDTLNRNYVELSMEILYQYITFSAFLFHVVLLRRGPCAFANRILFFDHWSYKLQTLGLVLLLVGTMGVGLLDFVAHDFYSFCA